MTFLQKKQQIYGSIITRRRGNAFVAKRQFHTMTKIVPKRAINLIN